MGEPEGQRVVAVEGAGAVLVVDALALALGVVVDVGDADRGWRLALGSSSAAGFGGALQPDVHPLQQVGLVEHRLDDVDAWRAGQAAVRGDGLDGAVERVVAGAALEGLGVELLRVQQPVGDGGVVADQPPRAAQQVALEVVGLGRVAVGVEPCVGGDAGGIEVPVDAGAQVDAASALAEWLSPYSILSTRMSRFSVRGSAAVSAGAAHGLLDRAAQRVVVGA